MLNIKQDTQILQKMFPQFPPERLTELLTTLNQKFGDKVNDQQIIKFASLVIPKLVQGISENQTMSNLAAGGK